MRVLSRALAVLALVPVVACAPGEQSPCKGLVYKEAGLTREEYLPCAAAMIDELDEFHQELQRMGDSSVEMAERQKARSGCMAANARLTRLIRLAGGSQKLVHVEWDDRELNRLSSNILAARDVYLMYCYYGPKIATDSKFELEREDSSHADARRLFEQLR